jgi:hypothetical protein
MNAARLGVVALGQLTGHDVAASSPRLDDREMAIVRSVLYASLFDYPLTLAELRQTLIESVQTASGIVAAYERSADLRSLVERREGFFFPRGRADLVAERRRREAHSRRFLDRHRRLLSIVCALPYVRLVALSGSVAHLNVDGDGDLDLFLVTRGRHVWSVTVTVVVLAKLLGLRRTVCANFVLADTRLTLDQRDLFTASQVIHLKPLVGVDVFGALIAANLFVHVFYPNFHGAGAGRLDLRPHAVVAAVRRVVEWIAAPAAWAIEGICRATYRRYLRRRSAAWRSPDQVRMEPDCLKLHTQSHRRTVMERFTQATDEALHRSQARASPS